MAGLVRDTKYILQGVINRRTFPVLATATFLKGDFLTLDTSGRLTQTVTAGNDCGALLFVGQAEGNSTNDNGTQVPFVSVVLCDPATIFIVPEWNTAAASSVFTPGTSNNQSTTGFNLRYQSTTAGFVVNNGASNTPNVQIVDVVAEDYQTGLPSQWPTYNGAGTTQFPHVYIKFLRGSCLFAP